MPQQERAEKQQSERPEALVFEQFQGVNTATTRAGVPDQMAYWLDGFMPLQPRNLRTLWGVGTLLYSAPSGLTIVAYTFFNIKAVEYAAVFLSDGSAVEIDTTTRVQTPMMPAGTITFPSITNIGFSQYGQQYLIIVSNQTNGYWVWDGVALLSPGGLAPTTTLSSVGSGYVTPPFVSASGGHGSGATFTATVADGVVTKVTTVNSGTGYLPGDVVTLVFSGGNTGGSGATLVANMQAAAPITAPAAIRLGFTPVQTFATGTLWQLTSVVIDVAGAGYGATTTITVGGAIAVGNPITGTTTGWEVGKPGIAVTQLDASGGIIGVQVITNPANPQNTFFVNNSTGGAPVAPITIARHGGTSTFIVASVTVVSGGANFSSAVAVTASGGNVFVPATFRATVVGGVITSVAVTASGSYGSASPPALTTTDTVTNAAGTANLMPLGIKGTAVSTYQQHVWVFNGPDFNFSAAGSVFDFSTATGGGSQQSNSSILRVGYTQALSALGFLFLIGDSSMDYISNVTSNNSGATIFSVNNADPETGSPYPASVTTLGLDVIMANPTGIWSSSSGAPFKRISEALDGVYNSVPESNFNSNPFNGFQISCAKATVFDKRVLMMLVPIVDPVSGQHVNKLLMTQDAKKWWASQQDVPLTFIATQEVNSTYTAWGTDGAHIYPLFQSPSSVFTKTAQSRLWDMPGSYDFTKSIVNLFAMAEFYGISNLAYAITVDSENGSTAPYIGTVNLATWTNAAGVVVQWQNGVFQLVTWLLFGVVNILQPTAVGQVGVLNGMTISTQCDDMAIISAKLQPEIVQYRA